MLPVCSQSFMCTPGTMWQREGALVVDAMPTCSESVYCGTVSRFQCTVYQFNTETWNSRERQTHAQAPRNLCAIDEMK